MTNLRYHFSRHSTSSCKQADKRSTASAPPRTRRQTRQFHPLTLNVLETPKSNGVGMAKVEVSFCQVIADARHAKNTHFWESHPETLKIFVTPHGEPCKTARRPRRARAFGSHRNGIRPGIKARTMRGEDRCTPTSSATSS